MAIAFASPSAPMDSADKQKYRTRAAASPKAPLVNLHVSIGAHNLRILKKAGGGGAETPRSTASTPTPTGNSKLRKYERKSKRFLWPDELHRLFVAAIFDVGLKNASPKALLSIMLGAGATNELTTEHLKSHLQKYRLNYERSRLEFLEFYDESARRSHKRRRKSGSASRSGNSSDQNSGFVFPISHKRRRGDASSDDASGSDATSDMEDESASPSGSPRDDDAVGKASTAESDAAAQVKSESRQTVAASATRGDPLRSNAASASGSTSGSTTQGLLSEPATLTYVAPITPCQSATQLKPAPQKSNASQGTVMISDRMVAAAAAAAVAAVPYPALTTLNDPQWHILNSLISPQLGAARGSDGGVDAQAAAGTTAQSSQTGKPAGALEHFSLSGAESADLQMQMHLAMQAQMNLHRQMLTRKVEVSQHLSSQQATPHPQVQANGRTPQEQSAISWSSASALASAKAAALNSVMQAQAQAQASAAAQQASSSSPDLASTRLLNSMLDAETGGTFMSGMASSGFSQSSATASAAATTASVESAVSSTLLSMQTTDFGDTATLSTFDALPGDKIDDGEALADLYRWDKMDFSMELEDDDLFGFLKS